MTSDLQAREEETSRQIAALTAELKKSQWEKGLIEQRADTLTTVLALTASASSEVHALPVVNLHLAQCARTSFVTSAAAFRRQPLHVFPV